MKKTSFGVFGLIPSAINVSNTNEKIQSDFDSRVLKSGNMVPGAITEGLVFFDVPRDISTFDNWRLVLIFKEMGVVQRSPVIFRFSAG